LKANHDKDYGNHSLYGCKSGQDSSKILNTVADFGTTKKYAKTSWDENPLSEDEKKEMKEEFAKLIREHCNPGPLQDRRIEQWDIIVDLEVKSIPLVGVTKFANVDPNAFLGEPIIFELIRHERKSGGPVNYLEN